MRVGSLPNLKYENIKTAKMILILNPHIVSKGICIEQFLENFASPNI